MKTLTNRAFEAIRKNAALLREKDPGLSEADSLIKYLQTPEGRACYEGYVIRLRRGERASEPEPAEKKAEASLGPVTREVLKRKEALIEKSGGKLSQAAAYEKIFRQDPGLYRRYVKEVTLSTAVG